MDRLEDLVGFLISHEDRDCEDDDIGVLCSKYDISYEMFENLIADLLPLCMVAESLLTKKVSQGFANNEESMWLIKRDLNA